MSPAEVCLRVAVVIDPGLFLLEKEAGKLRDLIDKVFC